ncbi:5-methyltetrahydropteroyltriglutamate--homocysteine S-methyltransferase [Helicobacter sp. MIT 14-3879]|uniref:5-methyltetrahydropteroyltriglutamate-- homocysteine S-methyltransferase n=1 Tax=Helicobacter sp. MIT 14-3879 TaxID=2040649 RepID=UPI000E1EE82B|nr:5-methyltetrahydropteroyltriglutamate--homocysteine S-methyltransferase [Helicobacter sp. MIT 14-3879]RDU65484.1 5-methyltetrahydropteroyltriglutamate--homocysteine S-methyltransferase [Helicobacter sp. MIT 14-3879]
MANIVGFPRIGKNRELKKALEAFWTNKINEDELNNVAKDLRKTHWEIQKELDFVTTNDFSFYDNMLDLAISLGVKPKRFEKLNGLEAYFAMARGHRDVVACEMTKWFNTNYHFVVPELDIECEYKVNATHIISQYKEAKSLGYKPKISIIGLFTFFALSKINKGAPKEIFKKLKSAYFILIEELAKIDSEVLIEFSEPIFACGISNVLNSLQCSKDDISAIECIYNNIAKKGIKAIVTTFFEHSKELTEILVKTDIYALGLDFVYGKSNLDSIKLIANSNKCLYIGIIDGRNIWRSDLVSKLKTCNEIAKYIPKDRLFISSSCSLLHSPFSKDDESKMDKEILSWQCYAKEKIQEILLLEDVFKNGINSKNNAKWEESININNERKQSNKIHKPSVKARLKDSVSTNREKDFKDRINIQREKIGYSNLTTTTIGSFPQTPELRAARLKYKKNEINKDEYENTIKEYIKDCVKFQEEVGFDVLVHGEPERNDMVEYFGEQMDGFVFSQNAWVQSYGSRCVKPPIIYGDISRPNPMTLKWIKFAKEQTKKPLKGMLTGPVTILNWSFVRDDIERKDVCRQIAYCIRDEINDLQNNGINIIQVDEAAFKEGYPLRAENIANYEKFALDCFKISTSIAKSEVQIHTHMCYSEFNDIIKTIEAMDADVISIECARSGNELLKIFKEIGYNNEIGPGVYDIHSPRIPSVEEIVNQIKLLLEVFPKEKLWINPDCGLKTRQWDEVKPALENIIKAVKIIKDS